MEYRNKDRRGERQRRGGRDSPGPSADTDNSWRSSGSSPSIPQQSRGDNDNRSRAQWIDKKNTRGKVTNTVAVSTPKPKEAVDTEKLFAGLNKDVKSILDSYSGFNCLEKLYRLLSISILQLEGLTISWSNPLEDFVIFLKCLLVIRDERFSSLCQTVLMHFDGKEETRICEKFPDRVCQLFRVISTGLPPGKDSYSLLHVLINKTCTNSYAFTQLFGLKTVSSPNEVLELHDSLPYTKLVNVLTTTIVKSKGVLAFAERKSLFAAGGGPYTSFSQDMACILENLIYLSMKLLTSDSFKNLSHLNQELTWGMLIKLTEATPFNRLPSSVLHTMCRFVDDWYLSNSVDQSLVFYRSLLALLMQNDGVQLRDMKYIFEITPTKFKDSEIRTTLGNVGHCQSEASIFHDFVTSLEETLKLLDRKDISSDVFVSEARPALEYMQIFVGLSKYHFKESLNTCRNIFYVASLILIRAGRVEQLLREKGFQGAILEDKMSESLPGITLKFIGSLMAAVSEYVKGEFDADYVSSIAQNWFSTIQIFPQIFDLGSWTLGCLALDAMSAVNEDLFSRLSVEAQEKTLSFVVKVGALESHRPEIRAKCGRCLALMFDFQMLVEQSEPLWFTLNCIGKSLDSKHLQIRTSWAWALGKWSDALEKHHTNGETPNDLENGVLHVLKLIHICSKDVLKIRYNGYRTAASLFKWMPDGALEFSKVRSEISSTIDVLISQIGHGVDYKARWNAVYAVGCVFENVAIMSEMGSGIMAQSLPCLWTWIAQSQNYKERIQCAVAIRKIQNRGLFKNHYHTVWHRICLAITRLPVEDIDLAQKLKLEVAITLAELTSLMEPIDLSGMEQIVSEHSENLKTLFVDAFKMIPSERKEAFNRARDRVKSLRPHQKSDTVIDTFSDILSEDLSDEECGN